MIEVIAVEMGAAISVLRSIVIKLGERVEEEYIYIYTHDPYTKSRPRATFRKRSRSHLPETKENYSVSYAIEDKSQVETSRAEILIGSNGT